MANVLNVVNTFADQAEAFGAPESDIQLVNFGMHIITSSTTIFTHDIRLWNRQRQEDKTWANFQTHFTKAQEDYKLSRPSETPSLPPTSATPSRRTSSNPTSRPSKQP
jgi:hypothetical protein